MSRFEMIECDLWSRAPVSDVSASAKLIYLWSRTNPACTMSGVYRTRVEQIALDTSLERADVEAALVELGEVGLVRLADDGRLWACDRVQYLRGRNPGVAKSVARDIAELPARHEIRAAFLDRYGQDAWLRDVLRPLVAETVAGPSREGHQTLSDFPGREGNPETVSGRSSAYASASGCGSFQSFNNDGRARTREAMADEVWAHYLDTFHAGRSGPVPIFDEPRRRVVLDALAVRDVETCKRAIDGLARSDYHRGLNEQGTTYLDIRYALRGNEQRGESHEDRIDRMAAVAAGKESY